MGVKERRERQKERVRQDILDAARDLFVSEGYENVSMRRIADKIEYSPTTIYLYFENKDELFESLCEETFAKLLRTLRSIQEENLNPVAVLKRALKLYIEFGLKHPNHYAVSFMTSHRDVESSDYKDNEHSGTKSFQFLRASVSACINQGKLRIKDADMASQVLWAGIHGLTSLLIVHPNFPWKQRQRLIETLVETLVEGLA